MKKEIIIFQFKKNVVTFHSFKTLGNIFLKELMSSNISLNTPSLDCKVCFLKTMQNILDNRCKTTQLSSHSLVGHVI